MKKLVFIIFTLILINNILFSQNTVENENIRIKKRFGISIKAGGVTFLGLSLDAFIIPQLNIEFNILPIEKNTLFGIGGGLKYHPYGGNVDKLLSPYIGFEVGYFEFDFGGNQYVEESEIYNFYLPLGCNYIWNKGFDFSFDIGYFAVINLDEDQELVHSLLMSSLRFGYRF